MRALRAWTAILLVAFVAAGGSRTPSGAPASAVPEVCGDAASNISRVQPLPSSDAFLASSPAPLPAAVEEGGRTAPPTARTLRPCAPRTVVPAARVAAVVRDRLEFAHSLDVARLGWFSFGSTAPPPFRA
jgi:hypothetical protein